MCMIRSQALQIQHIIWISFVTRSFLEDKRLNKIV